MLKTLGTASFRVKMMKTANSLSLSTSTTSSTIQSVNAAREQSLVIMRKDEVKSLISDDFWLKPLIECCQKLPVCICICTADKARFGFPIIYVNKEFERITLYKQDEVIGRKCSLLEDQYDLNNSISEQEQIVALSTALKDAKPVQVALTNKRKDNSVFKNLLSMKPIFDQNGEYRYVISVQFDITDMKASGKKLQIANYIVDLLPDTIYFNDEMKLDDRLKDNVIEDGMKNPVESNAQ